MKAAIYNPYFDTLGGGELYTLRFAQAVRDAGYKVDIEWGDVEILKKAEKRFGINLENINVVESINRGDGYELCFWVSDGSIPTLKSRNNILHFQVPFCGINSVNLLNKMKLFRIRNVVCNSLFTKTFIDKEYGVKSIVIYPPCDTDALKPAAKKENVILYVGRFSGLLQYKGQDVLIKAFKKFNNVARSKWKLILAGGTEVGVGDAIKHLKKISKNHPIEIIESPSVELLRKMYSKSKLFWSASGFGVNELKNPEKVEHFGITVIEAMASGAIPFCYKSGGHKEIVKDGENGYLWDSVDELVYKSQKLISDKDKFAKMANESMLSSKKFSYEEFRSSVIKIIQ